MIFIYGVTKRKKVLYVGASVNPKRRLAKRRIALKDFTLEVVILDKATKRNWAAKERYWIARLNPKYNKHPGGGGGAAWKPKITKAFRKRRSVGIKAAWADPKKRKNLLTRNAARWATPEQMEAHLKLHVGSKRSAATRKKISAKAKARIRKPHTEKTKRKMRAAWRRRKAREQSK